MNYWITTQWPQRPAQAEKSFGVYVQEDKADVLTDMHPGDLVVFYESRTGRALRQTNPDGTVTVMPCLKGKGGVIKLAEIVSEPAESNETRQEYDNGTQAWWRYHAKAKVLDDKGFVSLADLNKILGYSHGNRLRGFGDKHSGVKKLDKAKCEAIKEAFKAYASQSNASTEP